MVDLLLNNGAKIESHLFGENALHYAARSKCASVIEILVDHGGNIHSPNFIGITPAEILEL
jgi:ankyrin repeat protein